MSDSGKPGGGWPDSFRRIGTSLLGLARARLELFAVEWQEEKLRLVGLCVWLAVAAILGLAGLLVAVAALALWLWTVAGYAGLILLALVSLGAAVLIVLRLRRGIKTGPAPFADTLTEFKKDAECLRNRG